MRIEIVSHQVSDMILSVSRELRFELGPFMRETGMPNPEVAPITWDELTRFVDAVVEHAGYEAFAEVVGDLSRLAPKAMVLFSAFVSPAQLYDFINGVLGPTMYPMLENRHIVHTDGTFELAVELREGFRLCENFFRVLRESQAAIPQFIGLPSSKVVAIAHARGGNYHITPPASSTLVSRARRAVGSENVVVALTEELGREVTRLAQAYERLWAASRWLGAERGTSRDEDD